MTGDREALPGDGRTASAEIARQRKKHMRLSEEVVADPEEWLDMCALERAVLTAQPSPEVVRALARFFLAFRNGSGLVRASEHEHLETEKGELTPLGAAAVALGESAGRTE